MPQPTAAKTIKVAIFLKVLTFLILAPSGLAQFKSLNHFFTRLCNGGDEGIRTLETR